MLKLLHTSILILGFCAFTFAQNPISITLYFETNSYELSSSELQKLDDLIALSPSDVKGLEISGHTDSEGSVEFNQILSKKRTEFVSEYLSRFNFNPSLLASKGELQPEASNDTDLGKSQNRRVKVSYLNSTEDGSEDGSGDKYSSLSELIDDLKPKYEKHCIDNRRDTILKLENGTLLMISADSFEDSDLNECIELKTLEVLKRSDMFLSQYNTKSNDKWLASGGMIDVCFIQNDSELSFKEGKEMMVMIPTNEYDSRMELFYSDRDSMNWVRDVTNTINPWFAGGTALPKVETSFKKCRFLFCRVRRVLKPRNEREMFYKPGVFKVQNLNPSSFQNRLVLEDIKQVFGIADDSDAIEKLQEISSELSELNYYAFRSSRLQPINCDYFPRTFPQDLIVSQTNSKDVDFSDVSLVFQDFNVVLPGMSDVKGSHDFYNVPEGVQAIYIGIGLKEGRPMIGIVSNAVHKELELKFKPSTKEEIQSIVRAHLDS